MQPLSTTAGMDPTARPVRSTRDDSVACPRMPTLPIGGLFPPKSEEACDLCSVEVRGEFGSGGVELCATGVRGRIYNMAERYRAFERALDSPIKSDECGGMGGR